MMALEKYGPLIMKNIAIMGAMVYLAVHGSEPFSLRRECSKKSG